MDVHRTTIFILSSLIPGPKAPGNDIDMYLQPLIDDLKRLWDIEHNTYDASKEESFQMYTAIL